MSRQYNLMASGFPFHNGFNPSGFANPQLQQQQQQQQQHLHQQQQQQQQQQQRQQIQQVQQQNLLQQQNLNAGFPNGFTPNSQTGLLNGFSGFSF